VHGVKGDLNPHTTTLLIGGARVAAELNGGEIIALPDETRLLTRLLEPVDSLLCVRAWERTQRKELAAF